MQDSRGREKRTQQVKEATLVLSIETRERAKMNHLYLLLFAIIIGCSKAHQEPAENLLVGQWTFEDENFLKDKKKNFGDIKLHGAVIRNGELDVRRGKFARVSSYHGPSLSEKTLVTWVSLQTTSSQAGSALTIERLSNGDFDAIVYGEHRRYYWVAGSGSGVRTVKKPYPRLQADRNTCKSPNCNNIHKC